MWRWDISLLYCCRNVISNPPYCLYALGGIFLMHPTSAWGSAGWSYVLMD